MTMTKNTWIFLLLSLCLWATPAKTKEGPLTLASYSTEANVDRQAELQGLFDRAAKTGQRVHLPAGTFKHSGILFIRGIDVSGEGSSTIIEGTTRNRTSLVLTGNGPALSNVKLTYRSTTRSLNINSSIILIENATRFGVSNVVIDGGDCAGILASNAHQGTIKYNDIRNTLADSIHITNGSSDIVVHNNTSHYSGDDGVAVVSYERDGKIVRNIEAFHNTIIDNKVARGMSVVGGQNVFYHDNFIKCSGKWAGIYIASESVFNTFAVADVKASRNIVKDCGGSELGQGGITVFTDYNNVQNVTLEGNVIADSKDIGVHIIGKNNLDITLKDNVILRSKGHPIYEEPETPPIRKFGNTIINAD